MTNTTNEETPKKPRKGSKAAIDAATGALPATSFAADLLAAAATEEPEWTWETSEEVIDVKLTNGDMADLLRANGADEEAKALVDRKIDATKADLKELKAESDAFASGMKDRNRSGFKGIVSRKAHWKVGTCFALNTVQYVDPITGLEVMRRSLTTEERQLELGMGGALAALKPSADLGETDPSDMTDPEALLADAAKGEITPSNVTLDNDANDDEEADETDGNDEDDSL